MLYSYDAENRITAVKTSRDKIYWEQDAAYSYYRHGPLARTVIGENRVQGLDYAYTIQGWLKGVNSTSVGTAEFDMGQDGRVGAVNNLVARDAYGFSLNYFTADYKPISSTVTPFTTVAMSLPADPVSGISTAHQLFNGNIGAMAVNISKFSKPMVYGYRYDQLNRIVRMDAFDGIDNADNTFTANRLDDYHEEVSYDPNGNIRSYLRNGTTDNSNPLAMDNLGYEYISNSNKLKKVTDAVSSGNYANDIDNQSETTNYVYDEIGNLIEDKSEAITSIEWTVYGKISRIVKGGSSIYYTYDAAGNRISKFTDNLKTFYVRDASGNVMSVYSQIVGSSLELPPLKQTEIHLYGSSRLGIYNVNVPVQCPADSTDITIFTRGNKFFELSNHLGNVLVTVSDKKIGVDDATWEMFCPCPPPPEGEPPPVCDCELIKTSDTPDGLVDYYTAEIVTANDYYPFGMVMPERKFDAGTGYRYGFNGKENDKDISEGGQDYGMRIYDGRLGRFLSIDPLTHSFANLTPYQYASNRPIDGVDLDGLEYLHFGVILNKDGAVIKKVTLEDFRNLPEAELNKIHHTKNFYKHFSAGFGSQGKGLLYSYFKQGEDGQIKPYKTEWEISQRSLSEEITRHGLYYGEGSITLKGPLFSARAGTGDYDFSYKPIDMVDALAKRHDYEEDVRGFAGWRHPQNIFADIKFVKGLEKYLTLAKDKDFTDPFTNKKPSEEALAAANNALTLFKMEIGEKKEQMLGMLMEGQVSQRLFARWEKKVGQVEKQDVDVPKPEKSDK